MKERKLSALILALVTVFTLTACTGGADVLDRDGAGGDAAEVFEPAEVSAEPEETEAPAPTEEPEEAEAPEVTETPEETEAPEVTETPAPAREPGGEVFGSTEAGVYANSWFGVQCAVPEDWAMATEEELLEIQGLTAQVLEKYGEKYAELYKETLEADAMCYVMAAYSLDGMKNINIIVEQLPGTDGLTEDSLLDSLIDQVGGDLESMGMAAEKNTYSLAGEDRAGVALTTVDTSLGMDVPIHQQIVVFLRDGYALQVTMTSLMDETGEGIDDIGSLFSPLP